MERDTNSFEVDLQRLKADSAERGRGASPSHKSRQSARAPSRSTQNKRKERKSATPQSPTTKSRKKTKKAKDTSPALDAQEGEEQKVDDPNDDDQQSVERLSQQNNASEEESVDNEDAKEVPVQIETAEDDIFPPSDALEQTCKPLVVEDVAACAHALEELIEMDNVVLPPLASPSPSMSTPTTRSKKGRHSKHRGSPSTPRREKSLAPDPEPENSATWSHPSCETTPHATPETEGHDRPTPTKRKVPSPRATTKSGQANLRAAASTSSPNQPAKSADDSRSLPTVGACEPMMQTTHAVFASSQPVPPPAVAFQTPVIVLATPHVKSGKGRSLAVAPPSREKASPPVKKPVRQWQRRVGAQPFDILAPSLTSPFHGHVTPVALNLLLPFVEPARSSVRAITSEHAPPSERNVHTSPRSGIFERIVQRYGVEALCSLDFAGSPHRKLRNDKSPHQAREVVDFSPSECSPKATACLSDAASPSAPPEQS